MDVKVKVVKRKGVRNLYLRWVCPLSGKERQKSARTHRRSEAIKAAGKWEAELNSGRYATTQRIRWDEFRLRYEDEKLSSLAEQSFRTTSYALDHLEREINPRWLSDVDATRISYFQSRLRKRKLSEATIATYLRHLRAALSWAESVGLIAQIPRIQRPKRTRGSRHMRGRPITDQEFQRMLDITQAVRPHDFDLWKEYLKGLWLSGLRLSESLVLSWDADASLQIDLSGKYPRLRILAEAEKGHQDRLLPITPDFAELLLAIPGERVGPVFRLFKTEATKSRCRVGRTISRIGKKAGIITDPELGKYVTAHDLRRSYGTRWAMRVTPVMLRTLMRHRSIETTMKHYIDLDCEKLAAELWQQF
ncbi:tyrosine-type recombinase/integrase [Bremerella alba]|uniref:Tyrosine recombinase XerC n=1 Tax=Bremerella alba TaxID=980252 RepID=A0A7V9A5N1_9BACT|nr:Tyrosine recombinase XerC [Bremerella alba]